jgi:hypothetical protein
MPHQGLSSAERPAARTRTKVICETLRGILEVSRQGNIVASEVERGEDLP